MDKKGAMQLSINMIVVLIIAVVVLGLALGFISGLFGDMVNKMGGQLRNVEDPNPANAANPITMSTEAGKQSNSLTKARGEDFGVKFSVYCGGTADCTNVNIDVINGSEITICTIGSSIPTIPARESRIVSAVCKVPNAADLGMDLIKTNFSCTTCGDPAINETLTKDFYVDIKE